MTTCRKALLVISVVTTISAVYSIWSLVDSRDMQRTVERYRRLCRSVTVGIDDSALAADHGDRQVVRNVLAMQHVLNGCSTSGDIDLDPLSVCYLHDDMQCAVKALRAIATQLPAAPR